MNLYLEGENSFFNINRQILKAFEYDEENNQFYNPKEPVSLIVPDFWKDSRPLLFSIQDKEYIESIEVPYDFGAQEFIAEENENFSFFNSSEKFCLGNSGDYKILELMAKENYEQISSLQDIIFNSKVEEIAGYKNYKINLLRALYFCSFKKEFKEIKFRSPEYEYNKENFKFENGVIYSQDKSILYKVLPSTKNDYLKISNSTELIAPKAFDNCFQVKKVYIPSSVINWY